MHPARIRNILWMLKRNGYETNVSSTRDANGHTHHIVTVIDTGGERWMVTGQNLDTVIAELLEQLASRRNQDSG